MCHKCGEDYHKGSCSKSGALGFAMFATGNNFALCPECRSRSLKIDGCNHMVCPLCKYEYCWICKKNLKKLGYKHFDLKKDPFGCSNNLMSEHWVPTYLGVMSRIYTVPAILWYKYVYKIMIRPFSKLYYDELDIDSHAVA